MGVRFVVFHAFMFETFIIHFFSKVNTLGDVLTRKGHRELFEMLEMLSV